MKTRSYILKKENVPNQHLFPLWEKVEKVIQLASSRDEYSRINLGKESTLAYHYLHSGTTRSNRKIMVKVEQFSNWFEGYVRVKVVLCGWNKPLEQSNFGMECLEAIQALGMKEET